MDATFRGLDRLPKPHNQIPSDLKKPLLNNTHKLAQANAAAAATKRKPTLSLRWLVLTLNCLLMAGNYYCYDNPAALHTQMEHAFAAPSRNFELYFQMMYSVYSLPNVLLPLIGGVLVDRVGPLFSLNLFALFVLAGQLCFAAGASSESLLVMLAGRTIFGLGGESISVANSAVVTEWFRGKELAMALGFSLSISRAGSVVNNWLSPLVANAVSLPAALWVGVGVCCISCGASVTLAVLDSRVSARLRKEERRRRAARQRAIAAGRDVAGREGDGSGGSGGGGYAPPPGRIGAERPPSPPRQVLIRLGQESDASRGGQQRAQQWLSEEVSAGEAPPAAAPAGAAADSLERRGFGLGFYLLSVSCVTLYASVLPFNNVASSLLLDRDYFPHGTEWATVGNRTFVYSSSTTEPPGARCDSKRGAVLPFCIKLGEAEARAALVMSEPYVLAALFLPILGSLVDRYGGRGPLMIAASAALIAAHVAFALTSTPAYQILLGIGCAYCCFAAVIWPSVPQLVPESQLGTAYGLLTSMQNMGLFAAPLIVDYVFEATKHSCRADPRDGSCPHRGVELYFAVQSSVGLIASVMLYWCFGSQLARKVQSPS